MFSSEHCMLSRFWYENYCPLSSNLKYEQAEIALKEIESRLFKGFI
jgi:hypothetical protein